MNYTIFDLMYPKYKITKPIRLIELFAGYGSQALALKYLGVPFEHYKICEWAIKSIQAYRDIHFGGSNYKFNEDRTKDDMVDFLYKLGVSSNYNEPMSLSQLNKLSEDNLKKIIENIGITNNLVNIQQVKGSDLEIVDTDKFDYILTYSFPCQDLSLAGKGKGMSDTSTRSGMLWEVERILTECNKLGSLPQVLLMENVPQVHSQDNIGDFNKWQLRLAELGYKNYLEDLIATDYGIPQTRNRCFMISILGDYNYTFPKKQRLELKLSDLLENNVEDKYYLSDKFIECMTNEKVGGYPRKERFEQSLNRVNNFDIANTITTLEGNRDISTFIKIKSNTKKGYEVASEGDCIDFTQPNSTTRRGRVQKNKAQTLTTQNSLGVVITNNYVQWHEKGKLDMECRAYKENKVSPTLHTKSGEIKVLKNDLRIRKLTPRECFRLMGVKDEDFDKVAKNQSNNSLYHLAGDSIVVNVLMAIFKELF